MEPAPSSLDVFISYATADRVRAFEICHHLESLGHSCWIAPRNIRAGHDYGEEIIRGIEQSRCFVLVLSAAANTSIYVKREVERAVSKGKPVFPVRVEDVMPSPALELHLASLHYLDAWTGVFRDHMATLAKQLSAAPDPDYKPVPPPPAPRWRRPVALAVTGIALLSLLFWWFAPDPSAPPAATFERPLVTSPAPSTTPKPVLEACRPEPSLPLVHCRNPTKAPVHVESPSGQSVIIAAGSGSNSWGGGGTESYDTLLPWLGGGTTARLEAKYGTLSHPVTLPSVSGLAPAVIVPPAEPADHDAPTLLFAHTDMGATRPMWHYLFLAPFDTDEVEWSRDSGLFTRVNKMPWQTARTSAGPFWLPANDTDASPLTLRWRRAGEDWSEPVLYKTDMERERRLTLQSLSDLVDNIACYLVQQDPLPPHARCLALRAVNLGEFYEDLSWGLSPDDLQPVADFNFEQWAHHLVQQHEQPADALPDVDCKGDSACEQEVARERQNRSNVAVRAQRALQIQIASQKNLFSPWPVANGRQEGAHILAVAPAPQTLYFRASPQGGGQPLTARIAVASQRPK